MISSGALDPNHPNNAELVYLLRSSSAQIGKVSATGLYFRLDHMADEFAFVTDEEFGKSDRFKILELRDKEIGDFRKLKMVPADEKDVDSAMLRKYYARNEEVNFFTSDNPTAGNVTSLKTNDTATAVLASRAGAELHEFERKRVQGALHLQQSRESVVQQLNIAAHKLTLADVVFEDEVPSISTGLQAMAKIFEPRRPLQPKRMARKKIPGQNLQRGDVQLLVSVLSARLYLTEKSPLMPTSKNTDDLRIYAEVTFQDNTKETPPAIGTRPTWNEKMTFDYRAPNDDYSPASLQATTDFIYISLFEIRTRTETERLAASVERYQRIEKRWLGTLKLRWSAVYFNTTIEGQFYVPQVEPSLLGQNQLIVAIYVTISPALLLPEGPPANLPTSEDASLIRRADLFIQKHLKSEREALLTVIDVTGKRVFVCRYLKSLEPPPGLLAPDLEPDVEDRRLARFVSLIPFVSDMTVFPVQIDVWATAEQFLRMLSGDDEEHACLLACYLLSLGRTVYLAIGVAIPEGRSTYAVSKTAEGNYIAWEPKSGIPYDLRDPFCPLQTIDCLVLSDNVYVNVQPSNRTFDINMNLNDKKMWEPFFASGEFTQSSESTPREQMADDPEKSREAAKRLKVIIRDVINRNLNKWREPELNSFSRQLSSSIEGHLADLERGRKNGEFSVTYDAKDYHLSGFTLQQPFTSIDAIIDSVRATRIWDIKGSPVNYVVAVHVEPYPMSVLAVWIYVGVETSHSHRH